MPTFRQFKIKVELKPCQYRLGLTLVEASALISRKKQHNFRLRNLVHEAEEWIVRMFHFLLFTSPEKMENTDYLDPKYMKYSAKK